MSGGGCKNRVVGPESIPEGGSRVFVERGPGQPPELFFPGRSGALAGKAERNLVVDIHPNYSIILVSPACDTIVDVEGFSDGDYVPLFLLWRTYQVDQQYSGRKIKCPKCSAAIVVEAAAGPKPPPAASPRKPPAPLKTAARIEPENAPAQTPPEQDAAADPLGPGAVAVPGLDGIIPQRSPLALPCGGAMQRRRPTTAGCGLPPAWERPRWRSPRASSWLRS